MPGADHGPAKSTDSAAPRAGVAEPDRWRPYRPGPVGRPSHLSLSFVRVVCERRLYREPAVFKTTVAVSTSESVVRIGVAGRERAGARSADFTLQEGSALGADDDARPSHLSESCIRVGAHGGPPWLGSQQPWAELASCDHDDRKSSRPDFDRISKGNQAKRTARLDRQTMMRTRRRTASREEEQTRISGEPTGISRRTTDPSRLSESLVPITFLKRLSGSFLRALYPSRPNVSCAL